MNLDRMTHDQLDRVAATRGVSPYPAWGKRSEKADAIRGALPMRATAVATAPLSGWPVGEVRDVPADDRLAKRAAAGLVAILDTRFDGPALEAHDEAPAEDFQEPPGATNERGPDVHAGDEPAALSGDLEP